MMEQWKGEALAGQKSRPISAKWFLYAAKEILPADSIILEETTLLSLSVHRYLAKPSHYISAMQGGLGMGLGVAAGTKLAYQDRPVTFIVGDGTFNYNPVLPGLGLCQEYSLPILIIILNNGGYMAMRRCYQRFYPEGWAVSHNTYFGVNIAPDPDYTKIAEAFNAYGERLVEPEDIEPALKRALQQLVQGKTALLDVIIDSK